VSSILVTTSEEKLWSDGENVVFLGEWAKANISIKNQQPFQYKVLEYHWNDRVKYNRDHEYLNALYESLLILITTSLNHMHGVNKSTRYWRILVGPWLLYFIQVCFDRWEMIDVASQDSNIKKTKIIKMNNKDIIPKDFSQFVDYFTKDKWNHWIYGEIIKYRKLFEIVTIKSSQYSQGVEKDSTYRDKFSKRVILTFIQQLFRPFCRNKKYFIYSCQFGLIPTFLLELSLKDFPSIGKTISVGTKKIDNYKRKNISLDGLAKNEFEKFLVELIPKQIPSCYIEGFVSLNNNNTKMPWPLKPKVILTATGCFYDEPFKAWAAEKVNNGSVLLYAQHGGHYGTGRLSSGEDHERNISDRFLSWGWHGEGVDPLPSPKLNAINKSERNKTPKKCLLVQNVTPRYSYVMFSSVVSSMQIDYFNQQFKFVEMLLPRIKNNLVVRLFPNDYGWKQRERWGDKFPHVTLDDSSSFSHQINDAKIVVATYNATTFLETFTANIPTLIFWDSEHWQCNDDSKYYFEVLNLAGILHFSPESAANKLNKIWNNSEEWWESNEVQHAIDIFCSQYAQTSNAYFDKWKSYLSKTEGNSKLV
jgi:putative transferase (TIGR04331 family)